MEVKFEAHLKEWVGFQGQEMGEGVAHDKEMGQLEEE